MLFKRFNFILLLAAVLILGGCFHQPAKESLPSFVPPVASSTPVAEQPAEVAPKKFYPKSTAAIPTEEPIATSTEPVANRDSFVVTPELKAKLYLVDIYNPGVCYGLPGPVPDISVTTLLANNQGLTSFLRSSYQLTTDQDVYTKIKQINAVMLNASRTGYDFNFTDAQCCTLKAYQGVINALGPKLEHTVEREDTKQNPC